MSNKVSEVVRGDRAVQSERVRNRGRGETALDRKRSRASFKGWDTRLQKAATSSASSTKSVNSKSSRGSR